MKLHQVLECYQERCRKLEDQVKEFERREMPRKKIFKNGFRRCLVCDYVVDYNVPSQRYCDRCGQRLSEGGVIYERS